ncbi:MAG: hypothetical protein U9Q94_05450 [Candidatus Bipolaricaulota bacterium]|nr:hypothetical protein [Candidatus Bipolaricaulota bacterium]
MSKIVAVIMHAPLGGSPGEALVEGARAASSIDLAGLLHAAGIEKVILVTEDVSLAEEMQECGASVVIERGPSPFHFGHVLKEIIREHGIDGLLYFGSGSGGLLDIKRVRALVRFAEREEGGALFNNFYSCDYATVVRAQDLLSLDLPAIDNSLGLAVADAGIGCFALPREVETQYDIDTPTDVLLLAATGMGGEKMRRFTLALTNQHRGISGILPLLRERDAQIAIIGRVNPLTWAHFEQEVACRTSVLSEGRGMRSYPSERKILIGDLLKKGTGYFFKRLEESCDGAIIDTRPLLARGKVLPPASDRFASDLFDHQAIADPLWRKLTLAASEAKIPIVLGGHSLVSGGLYLLAQAGWKDHDLRRRLHPDTIDWQKEQT